MDRYCIGLVAGNGCGLGPQGGGAPKTAQLASLAAPHQRGDCDIGCLDCLPCDAACDLPLSKRQEQWLNENWPLLLFGTAVIAATAYILYTALF